MSFIGAGELEHKITQLQRQLSHKGERLTLITELDNRNADLFCWQIMN